MNTSVTIRKRLIALVEGPPITGNHTSEEAEAPLKMEFHTLGRRILRDFANNVLRLKPGTFSLRSNMGGPAVPGEITLHTDPIAPDATGGLYVQIRQGFPDTILYRTCKDRKDCCGGTNNWTSVRRAFGNDDAARDFADTLKSLVIPLRI